MCTDYAGLHTSGGRSMTTLYILDRRLIDYTCASMGPKHYQWQTMSVTSLEDAAKEWVAQQHSLEERRVLIVEHIDTWTPPPTPPPPTPVHTTEDPWETA